MPEQDIREVLDPLGFFAELDGRSAERKKRDEQERLEREKSLQYEQQKQETLKQSEATVTPSPSPQPAQKQQQQTVQPSKGSSQIQPSQPKQSSVSEIGIC